jgi:DNA adenine methylase
MGQTSLFGDDGEKVVNVATVPMRSPFRYPGGKTWLVPRLRRWLRGKTPRPSELVEPFAGGGIVGLTTIFEGLAEHVTMVELDEQVVAVWEAILNGHGEELAERIVEFELTEESVRTVLEGADAFVVDRAFRTILKNRVNRGGILAPGASLLKNGEKGKGLLSRWYSETLKERILNIARVRDQITFIQGDGLQIMRQNAHRPEVVFFIDPPYTVAAKRLYSHWEMDHEELFSVAETLEGDFLMTYDNDGRVRSLARDHGFEARAIPMKNTHHAEITWCVWPIKKAARAFGKIRLWRCRLHHPCPSRSRWTPGRSKVSKACRRAAMSSRWTSLCSLHPYRGRRATGLFSLTCCSPWMPEVAWSLVPNYSSLSHLLRICGARYLWQ